MQCISHSWNTSRIARAILYKCRVALVHEIGAWQQPCGENTGNGTVGWAGVLRLDSWWEDHVNGVLMFYWILHGIPQFTIRSVEKTLKWCEWVCADSKTRVETDLFACMCWPHPSWLRNFFSSKSWCFSKSAFVAVKIYKTVLQPKSPCK